MDLSLNANGAAAPGLPFPEHDKYGKKYTKNFSVRYARFEGLLEMMKNDTHKISAL